MSSFQVSLYNKQETDLLKLFAEERAFAITGELLLDPLAQRRSFA